MAEPLDDTMASASQEGTTPGDAWGWSRTHRVGIATILGITLVFLILIYARNPNRLDDPVVMGHPGEPGSILEQQLDPNSADAASLSRLPHIGKALADRIITYREENAAKAIDGIAFHTLDDLDKVGGLGPKTRDSLRPFLKFPTSSTSAPVRTTEPQDQ